MSTQPATQLRIRLTRAQLLQRVNKLHEAGRVADANEALELIEKHYGGKARKVNSDDKLTKRDAEKRASYAGQPERYFRDILGVKIFTSQQEDVLRAFDAHRRVLVPSGNGLGKTWIMAGYACYVYDALAALPDALGNFTEQGGRILLPAPTKQASGATIYHEMQAHAELAAARGFPMPGIRGKWGWWTRNGWDATIIAPQKRAGQKIAHAASGRHHANMTAFIEEAAGVLEDVWLSVEGMCSGPLNKIFASFQPQATGPAHQRSRLAEWKVIHLSAFDHPNVRTRKEIVPGAVGAVFVDAHVRHHCQDVGAASERKPDPIYNEFVYALPVFGTPEREMPQGADPNEWQAREDGHPGHPAAALRVYRPDSICEAQVLGQWPSSSNRGLFSAGLVQAAFARFRGEPQAPPDRVGFDVATEGDDDSITMPAWGRGCEWLIYTHQEAVKNGDEGTLEYLRAHHAIVGAARIQPKGDTVRQAEHAVNMWPLSPFVVDAGGVGAGTVAHLRHVIRADVADVQFGGLAPRPMLGEPWSEHMRTAMYVRASMLVRFGLVDIAPDDALLEELLAQELTSKQMTADIDGRKERVESVQLIPKEKIHERIGRSPDRSDAFVLALTEQAQRGRERLVIG